jgi:hypothetical protein
MEGQTEVLQKFIDVHNWLLRVALKNDSLHRSIIVNAITAAAKEFNLPENEVSSIISASKTGYKEKEIPIVEFYYNFLRNMRVSSDNELEFKI